MKLYCRIEGSGFPVIILHGLLGSSDNWRAISTRLSPNYKIFTADLRNHGRSPHSEIMTYPAMADDLGELMERETISECHVVGHSMGGKVAMQFATSHPDRVSKLVIVDIAPKAYPPSQRADTGGARTAGAAKFSKFRRNRCGPRACHSRSPAQAVFDEKYYPSAVRRFSMADRSCFHRQKL